MVRGQDGWAGCSGPLKGVVFRLGSFCSRRSRVSRVVDVSIGIVRVDATCLRGRRCVPVLRSVVGPGSWSCLRFRADVPGGGRSAVHPLRVRRFTLGARAAHAVPSSRRCPVWHVGTVGGPSGCVPCWPLWAWPSRAGAASPALRGVRQPAVWCSGWWSLFPTLCSPCCGWPASMSAPPVRAAATEPYR